MPEFPNGQYREVPFFKIEFQAINSMDFDNPRDGERHLQWGIYGKKP